MENEKLDNLDGEISFMEDVLRNNFKSARMILSHLIDDVEKLDMESNPVINEVLTKTRGIHCLLDAGVCEVEGHTEKSRAIVGELLAGLDEKKV